MCLPVALCSTLMLSVIAEKTARSQDVEEYKTSRQIEKVLVDSTSMNYHFAAWDYPFIGEYKKSMAAFDKATDIDSPQDEKTKAELPDYQAKSAANYIINRSKQEQIIIINEAHHQPLHRVFTESLLEGLYQNGFRYLGLEALAEDSLININKWPRQNDGFYTREPQFGNMIRKALKTGFLVFGYEAEGNGTVREKGQARNIQKILDRDPKAKILLHCGFSHVVEGAYPAWGLAMAGELKASSGINPLTIDQVELSEHSEPKYESVYYDPDSQPSSVILLNKAGNPVYLGDDSPSTDLQIIHPRSRFISGRPDWLLRNNAWKLFNPALLKINVDLPYIVAAHYINEDENSVAADIIEVLGKTEKSLVLPTGDFILRITGQQNKSQTVKIRVD